MITIKGGDGTSRKSAIIILGADDNLDGISAEYKIIGKEWKVLGQALHETDDNFYDKLVVQNEVWFDITDFYWKWGEGDLAKQY